MVVAIIAAGGSGTRMGCDKQLMTLAGKPVVAMSMQAFQDNPGVDAIVVTTAVDRMEHITSLAHHYNISKLVKVVPGGTTRQESVRNGYFAAAELQPTKVLIHDGARPFVSQELISNVLEGLDRAGAAVPCVAVKDTIKVIGPDGYVVGTPDRSTLMAAQTPQGMRAEVAALAYGTCFDPTATDDVALAERAGAQVLITSGDYSNIKLTTPEDLRVFPGDDGRVYCCGFGQDSHRFAPEGTQGELMLCGVNIPNHTPMEANSDGDVILHAVTNAISGITGVNILGSKADKLCLEQGIKDSSVYLEAALAYMDKAELVSISMSVECLRPKLSPYIPAMKQRLSELTGLPTERIGITATTGEGLTDCGRGLGIEVLVVATARLLC